MLVLSLDIFVLCAVHSTSWCDGPQKNQTGFQTEKERVNKVSEMCKSNTSGREANKIRAIEEDAREERSRESRKLVENMKSTW